VLDQLGDHRPSFSFSFRFFIVFERKGRAGGVSRGRGGEEGAARRRSGRRGRERKKRRRFLLAEKRLSDSSFSPAEGRPISSKSEARERCTRVLSETSDWKKEAEGRCKTAAVSSIIQDGSEAAAGDFWKIDSSV
jgi:hypothetical protein